MQVLFPLANLFIPHQTKASDTSVPAIPFT